MTSATIEMTDLSQQKRVRAVLGESLTRDHTVGQAIEFFRSEMDIPDHGLRWLAFSRGRRLDNKSKIEEVPDDDVRWTVLPEVTAGA